LSSYLVRRILSVIPSMLLVYTIIFTLIHLTPGNPWDNLDKPFPPEVLQNLDAKYHLNDPLWKQYVDYLGGVVTRFDFGPSYKRTLTANDIIGQFFPVSLQLGAVSFTLAVVLGVGLGIISAVRQNTIVDHIAMFFSVFGVATPSFVITTLMILVFAVDLHLVPTSGWNGLLSKDIIIPAIALALGPMAIIARFARASMLETIRMDYVRTARAKGLTTVRVILRHALPNALIPVVTIASVTLADLITGSFFVESICGVPGIGRYFVSTVQDRDYPVLMAVTLLYAVIIWIMNLVADVSYAAIDPRVRLQ
jgi:ABC-type dipeptide/oligopeptide/nickel transport system permease component